MPLSWDSRRKFDHMFPWIATDENKNLKDTLAGWRSLAERNKRIREQ